MTPCPPRSLALQRYAFSLDRKTAHHKAERRRVRIRRQPMPPGNPLPFRRAAPPCRSGGRTPRTHGSGPVHRSPPWSPPTSGSPVRSPSAPTDIVQGARAASNPVCLLLRLDCLKIAELAGSQHRHERLHLPPAAAAWLADRQFLAGKVHEQLVGEPRCEVDRGCRCRIPRRRRQSP